MKISLLYCNLGMTAPPISLTMALGLSVKLSVRKSVIIMTYFHKWVRVRSISPSLHIEGFVLPLKRSRDYRKSLLLSPHLVRSLPHHRSWEHWGKDTWTWSQLQRGRIKLAQKIVHRLNLDHDTIYSVNSVKRSTRWVENIAPSLFWLLLMRCE